MTVLVWQGDGWRVWMQCASAWIALAVQQDLEYIQGYISRIRELT